MTGTIIMIVILVLAPVGILMSSTAFVALFTGLLNRDVDTTHQGSELMELAESGMTIKNDD